MTDSAARRIAEAFAGGTNARAGYAVTNGIEVWYRGNCIARRTPAGVEVSLLGWDTVTTRRYLNAVCKAAGACNAQHTGCVWRERGQTWIRHLDGSEEPMASHGWYLVRA
jgi:hypothetical protein